MGSTLDVNPGTGEPGLAEAKSSGGGVAECARGLGWLEAVGEAAGEE